MPTKVFTGQITGLLRWIGPGVLFAAGVTWFAGRTPSGSLNGLGYWSIAVLTFFLLGIAAAVARPAKLVLSEDGFLWQAQLGSLSAAWSDVEAIAPLAASNHLGPKIGFRFRPETHNARRRASELNRTVTGYDRSIPNVWNMPTEELVHVLNDYMLAARSQTASS